MKIRPTQPAAVGCALGSVALAVHGETPPELVASIQALARESSTDRGFDVLEELSRPWARTWIARTTANDELAGFLLAWHVADELHILNVAVAPTLRMQGFGLELMTTAIAYAARERIRIVLLEVRRSNRAAIRLYRRMQFSVLGIRPGYYNDNGEDAVEMVLPLDPATGELQPSRDEMRLSD